MVIRPKAVPVLVDARPRVATGIEPTINRAANNKYRPLFETFIRYSCLVASSW